MATDQVGDMQNVASLKVAKLECCGSMTVLDMPHNRRLAMLMLRRDDEWQNPII